MPINEEEVFDPILAEEEGTSTIYNNIQNKVIIPQYLHYRYRGEDLKNFNYYSYCGIISIIKIKQENLQEHLQENIQVNIQENLQVNLQLNLFFFFI